MDSFSVCLSDTILISICALAHWLGFDFRSLKKVLLMEYFFGACTRTVKLCRRCSFALLLFTFSGGFEQ